MSERDICVIEFGPFSKEYQRHYFLANEEERRITQAAYPAFIVRVATEEEKDSLQGKTWEQMEADELKQIMETYR